MKILAIETSCDETAVAILECTGDLDAARFNVLGNALYSQAEKHSEYGGVYPNLAKREHAANFTPLLQAALAEAEMLMANHEPLSVEQCETLGELLSREADLANALIDFTSEFEVPDIDAIAVTHGPGLEPALWVGLNAARALSYLWNKPIIPTNHIEGHIVSSLTLPNPKGGFDLVDVRMPTLALIVSGGHTELVYMTDWFDYRIIGGTRDDAAGEAFDKFARMLGLPYPGGPEISKLAEKARREGINSKITLPRPMLTSADCDFSFSGLKTAALYSLREYESEHGLMGDREKKGFAREFEEAVIDVLVAKTRKALSQHKSGTLVIGGGVSASKALRVSLQEMADKNFPDMDCAASVPSLATDNAVMIGMAAFMREISEQVPNLSFEELRAQGNLKLQ